MVIYTGGGAYPSEPLPEVIWRRDFAYNCMSAEAAENCYWDTVFVPENTNAEKYVDYSACVIQYTGTAIYAVAPINTLENNEDFYQTEDLESAMEMALVAHRLGLYDHLGG